MTSPPLLRRLPLPLALAAAWLLAVSVAAAAAPRFGDDGALVRPEGYREWVYLGAPLTPNDLNHGEAAFPGFHNVYIDPASFARYRQTGEFPDGTVIVREMVAAASGATPDGAGYFPEDFSGLQAKVKDSKRFPYEPGHWAYFSFGSAPSLAPAAEARRYGECGACHAATANEDTVFSQYYPLLRAARPAPEGATPAGGQG